MLATGFATTVVPHAERQNVATPPNITKSISARSVVTNGGQNEEESFLLWWSVRTYCRGVGR